MWLLAAPTKTILRIFQHWSERSQECPISFELMFFLAFHNFSKNLDVVRSLAGPMCGTRYRWTLGTRRTRIASKMLSRHTCSRRPRIAGRDNCYYSQDDCENDLFGFDGVALLSLGSSTLRLCRRPTFTYCDDEFWHPPRVSPWAVTFYRVHNTRRCCHLVLRNQLPPMCWWHSAVHRDYQYAGLYGEPLRLCGRCKGVVR